MLWLPLGLIVSFIFWCILDRIVCPKRIEHETVLSLLNLCFIMIVSVYIRIQGEMDTSSPFIVCVLLSMIGYNLVDGIGVWIKKEWHFVFHHAMVILTSLYLITHPGEYTHLAWLSGPLEFTSIFYNLTSLHQMKLIHIKRIHLYIGWVIFALIRFYCSYILLYVHLWTNFYEYNFLMTISSLGISFFSILAPFVLLRNLIQQ